MFFLFIIYCYIFFDYWFFVYFLNIFIVIIVKGFLIEVYFGKREWDVFMSLDLGIVIIKF